MLVLKKEMNHRGSHTNQTLRLNSEQMSCRKETNTQGYFCVYHLEVFVPHVSLPPWSTPFSLSPLCQHNSYFLSVDNSQPESPALSKLALLRCCAAPATELFSKGQEGPSLAQCLMGCDSSVFWD